MSFRRIESVQEQGRKDYRVSSRSEHGAYEPERSEARPTSEFGGPFSMIRHFDFPTQQSLLPQKKTFDGAALLDLIKQLIRLDRDWVPREKGYSLYIRPVMSASLSATCAYPH